jgi:hypothetical protein
MDLSGVHEKQQEIVRGWGFDSTHAFDYGHTMKQKGFRDFS